MAQTKGINESERGDLIEIFRGVYKHWAVYTGDGYVVHLVNPNSCSESQGIIQGWFMRGKVRKEKLEDVVSNNKWQISNKLDGTYTPRPSEQIVKDALSMVDKNMYYSVTSHNCEHFATKLRYGKGMSSQVPDLLDKVFQTACCIGVATGACIVAAPLVSTPIAVVGGLLGIGNIVRKALPSTSVSSSSSSSSS